ncbi:hypothetical protein VNO77_19298 [Canavalia gladiata]|uniref:Uncharacterized protein n=1 Tax=Canavalia gladiata TaxID=3824 RepID=A0AAN9QPH0_CANGL
MHSKTEHKFLSSMSKDPEVFLTKDDKEDLCNFDEIMKKRHTLKFQSDESIETISTSSKSQYSQDNNNEEICRIIAPKQGDSESSREKLKMEDKEEEEDDDDEEEEEDGFKTPTSLDHRISVATQCPPAPRKIKPSLKRKGSYNYNQCHCRNPPLDLSKEVELLLFPTLHFNPLSDSQQRTKKVRREEHK